MNEKLIQIITNSTQRSSQIKRLRLTGWMLIIAGQTPFLLYTITFISKGTLPLNSVASGLSVVVAGVFTFVAGISSLSEAKLIELTGYLVDLQKK